MARLVGARHFLQEAANRVVGDGWRGCCGTDHQNRAQDCDELLHDVSPLGDSLVGCDGETAADDEYSN
ncbi:hypothetical protein ABFT80_27600 [Mesorhizobium sp. SB112]|uniref:hypothetical protein n=1 Tax=Mesorhizobium sp. SB112 TaxID=3151853 RepID=UPI003267ADEB